MNVDRFTGCVLGLALGDALGAPHEGGPLERLLWRCIGRTRRGERRWTDDTQMSIDLAESLVANGDVDADDLARRFAASYRWSRGYGRGTARVLRRIASGAHWREASRSVFPQGSFGNGGAMRAPVVGLHFAGSDAGLVFAAQRSAMVTHAHPLAIEGAVVVASATAAALRDVDGVFEVATSRCELEPFTARVSLAQRWLRAGEDPAPRDVVQELGNGIAAASSCVTAVYLAERFQRRAFGDLMEFVRRCGGDVDTIAAMAGAIWGAANGSARLPAEELARLEQRERLAELAAALWGRATNGDRR